MVKLKSDDDNWSNEVDEDFNHEKYYEELISELEDDYEYYEELISEHEEDYGYKEDRNLTYNIPKPDEIRISTKYISKDHEFQINEHLSLRLEGGSTEIYVDNQPFTQCKFLLMQFSLNKALA